MTISLRQLFLFLIAFLSACFAGATAAQASDAGRYPNRPIRMIVPVPPGGSGDIIARLVSHKLSERLGQQIVVDNRAGAAGLVGLEVAARAPADGYTLVLMSTSQTQYPAIQKVPYDPDKAFAPVAHIATGPSSICSYPGFQAQNIKDLVALARAKPGELRYASSGTGGINHFAGELFNQLGKVKLAHIPYKGGGPAIIDVIGGRVEVMFGSVLAVIPHVRGGKMKALGVTRHSPLLPEVAVISDTVPGYNASIWWGIAVPAGVPAPIVAKLNAEVNALLHDPEMSKRLSNEAAEPGLMTAEAFGRLLTAELAKWARVAKETGIRAE
jgi:tripartite-type tricarboxylate transporter receptor subunit TctC